MKNMKKCRLCKKEFKQFKSTVPVCIDCAYDWAKLKIKEKAKRESNKKHNALKRKLKNENRQWQIKTTKKVIQKWVNHVRDKGLPCISCGTTNNVIYCGGHYKTTGSHPERALWSMNIHRQCNRYCNMALSGNIHGNKTSHGYIKGIIERYGEEYFNTIDSAVDFKTLTIDDIKYIRKFYAKLTREESKDDSEILERFFKLPPTK